MHAGHKAPIFIPHWTQWKNFNHCPPPLRPCYCNKHCSVRGRPLRCNRNAQCIRPQQHQLPRQHSPTSSRGRDFRAQIGLTSRYLWTHDQRPVIWIGHRIPRRKWINWPAGKIQSYLIRTPCPLKSFANVSKRIFRTFCKPRKFVKPQFWPSAEKLYSYCFWNFLIPLKSATVKINLSFIGIFQTTSVADSFRNFRFNS